MKAKSKQKKVAEALKPLEVGQTLIKDDLIRSIWGDNDYFIVRQFNTMFCKAKKHFPERDFVAKNGFIIRIK